MSKKTDKKENFKKKTVKKRPGRMPVFTFVSIALFFLGLAIAIIAGTLPYFKDEAHAQLRATTMYVGLGVLAIGIIDIIICVAIYRYYDKHPEKKQPVNEHVITQGEEEKPSIQPLDKTSSSAQTQTQYYGTMPAPQTEPELMPDAVAQLDNPVTYVGTNVQYIPSMEAYEFINMGKYQTVDDKFDQISKMDHTQFVIYVARLFSRKGYQVKLTPVVDNYDIDIIVQKMDVTIAVGCLLTNKVLCKEDITCVREGKNHYRVNNCMALTNMYFDRTALDYAREEKMSLVDRNILAEDFMN